MKAQVIEGKHKRRKGAPISKSEEQWARLLYRRGLIYEQISEKTGISISRVGALAQAGKWKDDHLPPYDSDDFSQAILDYSFEVFLNIISGEEDDPSRKILDVKNLAATRKDVEELVLSVSIRSQMESAKLFMQRAAEEGRQDVLEFLQGVYDAKAEQL